jgi:hypothetical protein
MHYGDAYLDNMGWRNSEKRRLGATIVSELKCCKRCGAFTTCTTKGECCPECEWFDPIDNLCMAIPEKTTEELPKSDEIEPAESDAEVDPVTFLWEDDDEDEDLSGLPPEREAGDEDDEDDDSFGFDDDDDDWQ